MWVKRPASRASRCWSRKSDSISPTKRSRKSVGSRRSSAPKIRSWGPVPGSFLVAMHTSGALRTQHMLQARKGQYALHAFGFSCGHRIPQLRQAIVAASLVVQAEVRTLRRLFNHGVVEQPLDDAVQGARAQIDFVVGPSGNLFADHVTMLLTISER